MQFPLFKSDEGLVHQLIFVCPAKLQSISFMSCCGLIGAICQVELVKGVCLNELRRQKWSGLSLLVYFLPKIRLQILDELQIMLYNSKMGRS